MSPTTHYSKLTGKKESRTDFPSIPVDGQEFYHSTRDVWYRYNATEGKWFGRAFTSSTSTSTTTTTTSTSTTTTTTSTSSSTTTSTSTSTSTTTTL